MRPDGTKVVKLKRVLNQRGFGMNLQKLGFVKNAHDHCVFNRTEEDSLQSTLVVHIDDGFHHGRIGRDYRYYHKRY